MRIFKIILAFILIPGFALAQTKILNPKIEDLVNPIGIDIPVPRFSWQLESDKRNVMQTAYEIHVSDNMSTLSKAGIWNSGKVVSDQSVFIAYGGPTLESGKKYFWQARIWDNSGKTSAWTVPAYWQMGLLKSGDWKAKWIQVGYQEDTVNRPSPLFRKSFSTSKKITAATLFITAQGLYEAFLNGKRVGDACLTPGWTSYNKRLAYQAYDVTALVSAGSNTVGVELGSGWYRGDIGFTKQKNFYGKSLSLIAQIEIVYSDGTKETIITDKAWKCSTGSILSSEIYHGETIDSRKEKLNWNTNVYNDADWSPVIEKQQTVNLIAAYNEPIRKHETFKAIKIVTTPKGEKVIDFGQNLTGWAKVKVKGKPGDKITIYHAEVLDKAGNFYTENLRPAKQRNIFILKGEGEETFEPHFTFQGFRYIKVEGFPGEMSLDNFSATALYSDIKPTGNFTSSNPLINQLQHNIQWGQRGNFLDVPTDCPQRDERLGWTGDAQAFSRTAAYNFDVHNFFVKWLKDVAADQIDGSVPYVVPNVLGKNAAGSAGWADAATIIPWNMYLAYGDKRILEEQYESMKSWVGFMERNSTNDLWNKGFHFGDWLFYRPFDDNDGKAAVTDKHMIAQTFFAHSTQLVINAAVVLGKKDDADRHTTLLKRVKDAFVKEYMTPSGRLVSSTQTAYVLALNFDMLPESLRAQAAEKLAQNVKTYNNHLTTGFLGTPYLCHVLTRFGYSDVAYQLLLQETYPSWLYPVKMGATTIWERWDGIKPDSTFQTPGMNSFNHYAYGAIGDWMYRVAAGIDTQESGPGYKKIVIKPHPGGNFSTMKAELQTLYGKVKSEWKKEGTSFSLDVDVPPNTTAMVYLPTSGNGAAMENGKLISESKEIKMKDKESGYDVIEIGSGQYHFKSSL